MLTLGRLAPLNGPGDLLGREVVDHALLGVDAAAVDPAPEMCRGRDIRRGRDEEVGDGQPAHRREDARERLLGRQGVAVALLERARRLGHLESRSRRRGIGPVQEPPRVRARLEVRPFVAGADARSLAQGVDLSRRQEHRVVEGIALERQPAALDRVGHDHDGAVGVGFGLLERVEQRAKVMAAEIRQQLAHLVVAVRSEQPVDELVRPGPRRPHEALADLRTRLPEQGLVLAVRHVVDPPPQPFAVRPRERRAQLAAVLEVDDVPAIRREHLADPLGLAVGHHAVEALAVQIDDPEDIAEPPRVLLRHRLPHVALVQLRVADESHVPRSARDREVVDQVLAHQPAERRGDAAEPNRAGGVIDAVDVLGAARVGLQPAERAEPREGFPRELPPEVLERVKDRRGVRFDRDAIPGPEKAAIERGHDSHDGRAAGLMAADFEAVDIGPHVVGVVDHVRRQPQHALLDPLEEAKILVAPAHAHGAPDATGRRGARGRSPARPAQRRSCGRGSASRRRAA